MRILSAESMRAVDRAAIEGLGVPALVLMENAALGVVEAIAQTYPAARSAAIFCGPGNNGGDGLAVARHLLTRGYAVEIVLCGEREPAGDAAVQLAICRKLDLPITTVAEDGEVAAAVARAREADLIVDALFGTGLARPLTGLFAALVSGLSALPLPRVAVDLPSGLSGSRAEPLGPAFVATLTVTFAAPKIAHVFPPAAEAVGELVIADLGVPAWLVDEAEEEGGALHLLVGDEIAPLLPDRAADSNKGTYGHALLVAGSPGKAGAAILGAQAAVRAGAGLVTVAVPEPLLLSVDTASLESMTLALPAGPSGHLALPAVGDVLTAAVGKSVLALGPGLGQEPETAEAIRRLVLAAPLPLVLDADGLNAFAGRAADLAGRPAETVLTPHPGELGRLLGLSTAEVQADRRGAVRRAAVLTGAVVVLKGSLTLVATPEGEVHVNPTGNPAMATGGSGDVLTGILAGLLAQRLPLLDAVLLGVYLHGLAGDLAVARLGGPAVAASELIASLPRAFAALRAEGEEAEAR